MRNMCIFIPGVEFDSNRDPSMDWMVIYITQEINLANNRLPEIPDAWKSVWGTMNSTGRLTLPAASAGSAATP